VYNSSGSLENSGDLVLTAVQRVRQIGSFAKIDATVALAKDVLQEQPAVVIFTSFVSVAKTVHKQLAEAGWEGELLTGETPTQKRQPMVDNFQVGSRRLDVSFALVRSYLSEPNAHSASLGWVIACLCIDLRCRWRWNNADGGTYYHSARSTMDSRRGTTSRGPRPQNRTNQASAVTLDGGV